MIKETAKLKTVTIASERERSMRQQFIELYQQCPIPENEILRNLGLFINRQSLSRMLYMTELYRKIINVHGVVMEFGTRWGHNLALFSSLRGIYEPYNFTRKIVAFDTFEGFAGFSAEDGKARELGAGGFGVTAGYEKYLEQVLEYHEQESPLSHIRRFHLEKGDAPEMLERYLGQHPETIIALAYFDMDLYEPTKKCLELVLKHVTRGSLLGFDELNFDAWPGETIAVSEVLGLAKYKITRSPLEPTSSYVVIE
jgi:hypothetical protein